MDASRTSTARRCNRFDANAFLSFCRWFLCCRRRAEKIGVNVIAPAVVQGRAVLRDQYCPTSWRQTRLANYDVTGTSDPLR